MHKTLPDIVEVSLRPPISDRNYHGRHFQNFEASFAVDSGAGCLKSCNADRYEDGENYADVEGHGGSLLRLEKEKILLNRCRKYSFGWKFEL